MTCLYIRAAQPSHPKHPPLRTKRPRSSHAAGASSQRRDFGVGLLKATTLTNRKTSQDVPVRRSLTLAALLSLPVCPALSHVAVAQAPAQVLLQDGIFINFSVTTEIYTATVSAMFSTQQ